MKTFQRFFALEDPSPSTDDGVLGPTEQGNKINILGVSKIDETKSYGDIIKEAETKVSESLFPEEKVLPDLDASFLLISDQTKKLVDLKDLESVIDSDKGISQESASWVHDRTGDFFNQKLTTEHFTKTKTPINYEKTKVFLKSKIAAESLSLSSCEKFFMDQMTKLVESVMSTNFNQMLSELIEESKNLSDKVSEMAKSPDGDIFSSSGFFRHKQFQGLRNVELTEDFKAKEDGDEQTLPPRIKNLETAILSLAQCSKKHNIAKLSFSTLGEFLNCVGNNGVSEYLQYVKTEMVPALKERFDFVKSSLTSLETQPEDLVVDIQKLHILLEDVLAAPVIGLIFNRSTEPLIEFASTN